MRKRTRSPALAFLALLPFLSVAQSAVFAEPGRSVKPFPGSPSEAWMMRRGETAAPKPSLSESPGRTGAAKTRSTGLAFDNGPETIAVSHTGPDGDPTFDAFLPQVAFNPALNEYLVVWEATQGAGLASIVFGQRLDALTGMRAVEEDFAISSDPEGFNFGDARFPAVAYNSNANEYLVVWARQLAPEQHLLMGRRLAADGSWINKDPILVAPASFLDAFAPKIAYNPTLDQYLVVWDGLGPPDAGREIYGRRLDGEARPLGPEVIRISDMGPPGNALFDAYEPVLALNADRQEYLVVWQGDDAVDEEFEIYGQRLAAASGAEIGENDFRISDAGPEGDPRFYAAFPTVVFNPIEDEYLVVWAAQESLGKPEIYGQRLTGATAVQLGPNDFPVSHFGEADQTDFGAQAPSLVFDGDSNRYLATWEGVDPQRTAAGEFEIFGRFLPARPEGRDASAEFRVSRTGPDKNADFDAFAVSAVYNTVTGSFLAVWEAEGSQPNEFEIFGRQLKLSHTLDFAQFGNGAGQLFSQVVVFNSNPIRAVRARLVLRDDSGRPLTVRLNGEEALGHFDFEVPPAGVKVLATDGEGPLVSGSASVASDYPMDGVILFGGSIGVAGVGAGQARVDPVVAPIQTDLANRLSTGLALLNLEDFSQAFNFQLRDAEGAILAGARLEGAQEIPPGGHRALFVEELNWSPPVNLSRFQGTLVAEGSGRFGATVLQTRPAELVTMPVETLRTQDSPEEGPSGQDAGAERIYFAQFGAAGGDLTSQIILINRDSATAANVRLVLNDDSGQPLTVTLNGSRVTGEMELSIPPGGLRTLTTDDPSEALVGSVQVYSDGPLEGVILFGGSVGYAGVGGGPELPHGFAAPVELRAKEINTGLAVMNLSQEASSLEFSLFGPQGSLIATATLAGRQGLPASGHRALFVDQLPWDPPVDFSEFQGTLVFRADVPTGAILLQTRPGQFATLPVAFLEARPTLTWFGNPGDPLILTAENADGSRLEYYGVRDSDGLPVRLTLIRRSDASGRVTEVELDGEGRPALLTAFNGLSIRLEWAGNRLVRAFAISADGASEAIVELDSGSSPPFSAADSRFSVRSRPNPTAKEAAKSRNGVRVQTVPVRVFGCGGEAFSGAQVMLTVLTENATIRFTAQETAPGLYEAQVPTETTGAGDRAREICVRTANLLGISCQAVEDGGLALADFCLRLAAAIEAMVPTLGESIPTYLVCRGAVGALTAYCRTGGRSVPGGPSVTEAILCEQIGQAVDRFLEFFTGDATVIPSARIEGLGVRRGESRVVDLRGSLGEYRIDVCDQPLEVTIVNPRPGERFLAFQGILLQGRALTAAGHAVPSRFLDWSSNLSGHLANGNTFFNSGLPAGVHLITLRATDLSGSSGADQVTIFVGDGERLLPSSLRGTWDLNLPLSSRDCVTIEDEFSGRLVHILEQTLVIDLTRFIATTRADAGGIVRFESDYRVEGDDELVTYNSRVFVDDVLVDSDPGEERMRGRLEMGGRRLTVVDESGFDESPRINRVCVYDRR